MDMMKMNDHNDQLTFILMSLIRYILNLIDHDLSSVNITEIMNFKIVQDLCKNESLSPSIFPQSLSSLSICL